MKKNLEEEINLFLETWDEKCMVELMQDILPIFEMFDVDYEDDWVEKALGCPEEARTIRLLAVVYRMSKLAEKHSPKFAALTVYHRGLWKKMEKAGISAEMEKNDKECIKKFETFSQV